MNSSVNLILKRRQQGINRARAHLILNILAGVSVGLVILVSVGLYILERDSTYATLLAQRAQLQESLGLLKEKAILNYTLHTRVQYVSTILKARKPYDQVLTSIISAVPQGVRIDGYSLTTKALSLTISSPSLVSLNTYVDSMTDKVVKKETFSKLTVDSFILDERSGRYNVSMTMQLL